MRIALVSPRFWPMGDACARHAGDFAAAISRLGAVCTVLTPYMGRDKPREIDFAEFRVRSFLPLPTSPRTRWKHARNVAGWLKQNEASFDAIYCYGVTETTCAIIEKAQARQTPIFIRVTKNGPAGDQQWPFGGICHSRLQAIVRKADHIFAATEIGRSAWLNGKVEPSRVSVVPFGIGDWARQQPDREAARSLLAATHPIFRLNENAKVALFVGELTKLQPLKRLVKTWKKLQTKSTDFHLWLIGEGDQSDAVWQAIRRLELEELVLLPGQFDQPEPLYAAADVVLHPGEHLECDLPMLEAAASGKRIIAADNSAVKELLKQYGGVTFLPYDNEPIWVNELTRAIGGTFEPLRSSIQHEAEEVLRIMRRS